MAEDALLSITTLLQNLPIWIAGIEGILKDATERQQKLLAEHQPADSLPVVKRRRRSSVSSIWSEVVRVGTQEDLEVKGDNGEEGVGAEPEEENEDWPVVASVALLRPQLPHMTHSDALRLSQRKRKTASVCSGDHSGGPVKYRCRGLAVIYYDGDVQKRFEALVKAVQLSRHSIRKASDKMTAARSRPPDRNSDDSSSDADRTAGMSVREFQAAKSRQRKASLTPPDECAVMLDRVDVLLNKGQDLCERAAHQVLRDGDCALELKNAVKRLKEANETAEARLSDLEKRAAETSEQNRQRDEERKSRESADGRKKRLSSEPATSTSPVPSLVASLPSDNRLEVDLDADATDDDGEDFDASAFAVGKYQMRSTRLLAH
ncbi:hypothetical protein LTR78_002311 [Recurvomyces mirabilis]|uniref:Uncharacterized protein n=1 Tax=Recurvomyces mirabilis TaxID=574656 RepID=A0AAE1C505_9PEZI|nr:hypothetical protein LTR78_002311 [Recurvomyces mirabilis]KAK5160766.1 hypothetical protein LTS14_001779 [Recurvomyces mirabilis]